MRKRIFSCLFAILFCMCFFPGTCSSVEAKVKMNKQTLKLDENKVKQIKIEARDCNVPILKTSAKDPYCCYRKKISKVSMTQKDGKLSIGVEGTSDDCFKMKSFGSVEDIIFKIYLPEDLVPDSIDFHADHAGMSITYVPESDVNVSNEDYCSIGFVEPDDFKSSINIDFTDVNCSFYISEKHLKEVYLDYSSTNITYPHKLDHPSDKSDYRFVIELEDCNCTISTKEMDTMCILTQGEMYQ